MNRTDAIEFQDSLDISSRALSVKEIVDSVSRHKIFRESMAAVKYFPGSNVVFLPFPGDLDARPI